jgi:hypothetical protein
LRYFAGPAWIVPTTVEYKVCSTVPQVASPADRDMLPCVLLRPPFGLEELVVVLLKMMLCFIL